MEVATTGPRCTGQQQRGGKCSARGSCERMRIPRKRLCVIGLGHMLGRHVFVLYIHILRLRNVQKWDEMKDLTIAG